MAQASSTKAKAKPRTLCIDIGGTGLKAMILDDEGNACSERLRIETPQPATPKAILDTLEGMVKPLGVYHRISVGFPGVVIDGTTKSAPNLHGEWAGYPLRDVIEKRFGAPARVLNDAGVQGFGIIKGEGTEMVITLGTGMGCALFVDGRYVPNLELAHHPLRGRKTYEDYVGMKALKKVGKKRWNQHVLRVVDQINPIFNPTTLYIGGGNSRKLDVKLPSNVRIADNVAGLLGGLALWRHPP